MLLREKEKRLHIIENALNFLSEHATGIGPAYSAWEADVLPLNYACIEIIKAQSMEKKKPHPLRVSKKER